LSDGIRCINRLFSIALVIAIIFTIAFSATIQKVENDTIGVFEKAYDKVSNMIDLVADIDDSVNQTFTKVDDVFAQIDKFDKAFDSIDVSIDKASDDVTTVSNTLDIMDDKLDDLKSILDDINTKCNNQCPGDVPTRNDVPSIASKKTQVTAAQKAITDAKAQTDNSRKTISDMKDDIKSQVDSFKSDLTGQVSSVTSSISEPAEKIQDYLDKVESYYGTAKKVVNGVDGARLAIFLAIYIVVLVFLVISAVGVFCGRTWAAKLAACCSFWSPIIFLIIATLQLIIFVGLTDINREFEPGLRYNMAKYLDTSKRSIQLYRPGPSSKRMLSLPFMYAGVLPAGVQTVQATQDFNINSTELIDKILYCQKDGSFLDVTDFDIDSLNVTKYTVPLEQKLNQTFDTINVTSMTAAAVSYLDSFSGYTALLKDPQTEKEIDDMQDQLDDAYAKMDDLSNLGYPQASETSELSDLNTHSAAIGGAYFVLNNVSSLNPAASPYNSNTPYYTNKKTTLTTYKSQRAVAQARADSIKVDMVKANNTLNTIIDEVDTIIDSADDADDQIQNIRTQVNSFQGLMYGVRDSANTVIHFAEAKVTHAIDTTKDLVNCYFIGNYYSNTKANLRYIASFAGVICIDVFLLTIGLLIWFLLLLPATKKIGNAKHIKPEMER
jgi:peptidoglycan hydrolase CwlO-like protein